jgi:hypothetical protein
MAWKRKRKARTTAALREEMEADAMLRAIIFRAIEQAVQSGVFVAVRAPGELLAKLLEADERKRAERN